MPEHLRDGFYLEALSASGARVQRIDQTYDMDCPYEECTELGKLLLSDISSDHLFLKDLGVIVQSESRAQIIWFKNRKDGKHLFKIEHALHPSEGPGGVDSERWDIYIRASRDFPDFTGDTREPSIQGLSDRSRILELAGEMMYRVLCLLRDEDALPSVKAALPDSPAFRSGG